MSEKYILPSGREFFCNAFARPGGLIFPWAPGGFGGRLAGNG
jgi:hypothetical protein